MLTTHFLQPPPKHLRKKSLTENNVKNSYVKNIAIPPLSLPNSDQNSVASSCKMSNRSIKSVANSQRKDSVCTIKLPPIVSKSDRRDSRQSSVIGNDAVPQTVKFYNNSDIVHVQKLASSNASDASSVVSSLSSRRDSDKLNTIKSKERRNSNLSVASSLSARRNSNVSVASSNYSRKSPSPREKSVSEDKSLNQKKTSPKETKTSTPRDQANSSPRKNSIISQSKYRNSKRLDISPSGSRAASLSPVSSETGSSIGPSVSRRGSMVPSEYDPDEDLEIAVNRVPVIIESHNRVKCLFSFIVSFASVFAGIYVTSPLLVVILPCIVIITNI